MDKENVVYIHSGVYYSAIKNEIMSLAAKWLELESNMLSNSSSKMSCFHSYVESRPRMVIIGYDYKSGLSGKRTSERRMGEGAGW
jgi:hypothetical protein